MTTAAETIDLLNAAYVDRIEAAVTCYNSQPVKPDIDDDEFHKIAREHRVDILLLWDCINQK